LPNFRVGLTFYPGCPGIPTQFTTTDPAHITGSGQDGCVGATSSWGIIKK